MQVCSCGREALYKDACKRCYYKAHREKNKVQRAAYGKAYKQRPEVKARENERARERRRSNPDLWAYGVLQASKNTAKRLGYAPLNMSIEELLRLRCWFDLDVGSCFVCQNKISFDVGTARIDHCHLTGKFRGVLCNKCNCALGGYERVAAVAPKYLQAC